MPSTEADMLNAGGRALWQDGLRAIFHRSFNVVAAINLLVMTAYYMLFVTGTLHVRETYGASLSVAGLSGGIMVIGCLSGRFASGSLLSFFGCRAMLLAGLLLFSGSVASSLLAESLPLLFLQRLLTGIAVGVTGTATGTIIAYVVPREYHGLGISLFSMSTAMALAAGPFFGIALVDGSGYGAVVWTTCGFGLACLALFFVLGSLPPMLKKHRPMTDLYSYIDPRVVRFSLVALVACFGYGCVQAFLTSFSAERGLSDVASLFFLVYAAAALGTRPFSGYILDHYGENVVFYPALLIMAASMVLLAVAGDGMTFLLAGVLMGVGFGNFQSAGQAVSLTLVTRSRFAQATTTFFLFFDLGIGLGPYLFGFLVPVIGYEGMFLALALTAIVAAVLYCFEHGRLPHRR